MTRCHALLAGALALTLVPATLCADVTARMHTHLGVNPALMQMIAAMSASSSTSAGHAVPQVIPANIADTDSTMLISGDQASYGMPMNLGQMLMNLATRQITTLNAKTRQYTVMSMDAMPDQLATLTAQMPKMPPQAQAALAQLQLTSSVAATGKSDTILGIPVEETLITASLTMPMPGMPAATAGGDSPSMVTITLHIWTATAAGEAASPELGEMARFNSVYAQAVDPTQALQKLAAALGPVGTQLSQLMTQAQAALEHKVALRIEADVNSAFAAQMMAATAAAKGVNVTPPDPSAPMVTADYEVTSLSADPVPASAFAIPPGYTAAPAKPAAPAH